MSSLENQPVSEILHKMVETNKIKLFHHFSSFISCLQINAQRRPLDNWYVSQLQAQVHLLNILHSCRCFLQLASDLTVMQAVYNTTERREQIDIECTRLKSLMRRLSDMYLIPASEMQLTPLHDPAVVQSALCAVLHKTTTLGIPPETGLLGPCAENSSAFFKYNSINGTKRSGDVLTSKYQEVESQDLIESAEAAVMWLQLPKTLPPAPKRKQDVYHSRLMLHP
eukprot:Gregarina_sp_Poly_1__2904@NODE_180_length_11843_cov_115_676376_g160_i0_p5_GENE_NODE_180_length_11843_cov_115_676376_g160_i0NODE_180_length_11843_cov_115_676376_g160_i0_p5_ORF_typecomplete_len225_score23_52Med22/PF06179_12/0_22Med22/PF06179_12/5e03_NODE_180_length_11843_cov_115_676376_g160_i0973810412